jgi:predicted hydrocarbon binding protein
MENFDLRGTAKDFKNKKMVTLIVTMIYPAVLTYCYNHLSKEGAIEILRKLGRDIADDFFNIYSEKRPKFFDYIKDFFKIFYDSDVKVKKVTQDFYYIIDEKCILCTDITVLEGLPFHYCTPYAGSITRILDVLSERGEIPYKKYKVETISSRGSGDEACIHSIKLEG